MKRSLRFDAQAQRMGQRVAELIAQLEAQTQDQRQSAPTQETFECAACAGWGELNGIDCPRCKGHGEIVWEELTEAERDAEEERAWDAEQERRSS